MCNVHAHARGVAAGAEQRGAMDEAELANAYSSLCALHDSGEISTQERDRQLSLLRASSIVPPPPPSGAVDALRQRTSAALALAREHAAPKVEVLRERTSSALASARERAAPKVEELRERTSAALASARERAAPQVEELRERTSSALASARQAVDARVFGARRSASAERVPGRPPPTTTLPAAAGPSRFQPFAEGARHGPAPAPPPRSTAEPQPLIDLDGAVTNDLPRVGPFIDLSDAGMARPGTTDDAGALLLSELMDAPLADAPPAPRAIAHAASESNADATLLAVLGTEPASTVSPGVAAGRRDRRPVCRSPTAEEESARKEALARLAQWRATGANAAVGASDCGMAWVEHAMLAGMAPRVQGELWAAAWADHAECESYESLVDEAEKVRARLDFDWDGSYRRVYARLCAELDVIAEDVPRTALEDGGAVDAAELEALLWAHAIAEGRDGGQMGYVQGMADIGAFLLARCRPHQAFGCMRALLARPLVRLLLSLDVDEWLLLSTAVNNLLGIHLPALFVRLGEWQLDPAMCARCAEMRARNRATWRLPAVPQVPARVADDPVDALAAS